jgi:hypothetical protein
MNLNEYSGEDRSDAFKFSLWLTQFAWKILTLEINRGLFLVNLQHDCNVRALEGGVVYRSQCEGQHKELLDKKTQIEAMFLEHCGLLAKANALLEKCGLQGFDQIGFMKEIPDFSERNLNPNDDDWYDEWKMDMYSMGDKIQDFSDKILAATDTMIERLDSIDIADAPTSTTQEEAACSA